MNTGNILHANPNYLKYSGLSYGTKSGFKGQNRVNPDSQPGDNADLLHVRLICGSFQQPENVIKYWAVKAKSEQKRNDFYLTKCSSLSLVSVWWFHWHASFICLKMSVKTAYGTLILSICFCAAEAQDGDVTIGQLCPQQYTRTWDWLYPPWCCYHPSLCCTAGPHRWNTHRDINSHKLSF